MNKICINTKTYKLTQGQSYNILDEDGDYYYMINDNGRTVKYDKSLFGDAQPVEAVVAPPLPPPPPVRTERDCINSINIFDGVVRYTDIDNIPRTFSTGLSINDSMISCGVYQMSGISTLMQNIIDSVNTDENDFDDLIKALFTRSINEAIDSAHDHTFMMMSTNRVDDYEDFYTYLDELSVTSTEWENNPNSGNMIKMWTV